MDADYELETHDVEEQHWWYSGRRRVLTGVLRSLDLPAPERCRILDAGCGSGRNMVELAPFGAVTGLELAEASVARARARDVGDVVAGSLDAPLPFSDDEFDLAVTLDVIEHLDDDRGALRELRRVVRPGGLLLVTVPAYPGLWSSHDEVNHHRRRYTRRTLLAAAQDAGWNARRNTHFNSLLLPATAAFRALERIRKPSESPQSDLHRTPARLNRALAQPLHLEAMLIGSGRRIPFGLSLLGVFS